MPVQGISQMTKQMSYNQGGVGGGNLADKDVFFKILSAELSHQDPLKGKDGTEYVSQLAQFTTLEQTQQLYTAMNRLLMSQRVTEAGMMVGKEVEFAVRDKDTGEYTTEKGVVKSVKIEGGEVFLITEGGKKYALEQSVGFEKADDKISPDVKPDEKPEGGEVEKPENK